MSVGPQVAYRETITQAVKAEGALSARPAVKASMATAIKFEPNEPGKGYEFINKIVGGAIPKEYVAPIDKGIRDLLASAGRAGFDLRHDHRRRAPRGRAEAGECHAAAARAARGADALRRRTRTRRRGRGTRARATSAPPMGRAS